jgi:hypothetical protein
MSKAFPDGPFSINNLWSPLAIPLEMHLQVKALCKHLFSQSSGVEVAKGRMRIQPRLFMYDIEYDVFTVTSLLCYAVFKCVS